MATTSLSIRIDENLKAEADAFFADIGMNMTTAITCFFKKCLDAGEIPFKLNRRKKKTPYEEPLEAFEEASLRPSLTFLPPARRFRRSTTTTPLPGIWPDLRNRPPSCRLSASKGEWPIPPISKVFDSSS